MYDFQRPPVPWGAVMTSAPFWGIIIAQFTYNWGSYTLLTSLPKYLHDVLHFNLAAVGKDLHLVGVAGIECIRMAIRISSRRRNVFFIYPLPLVRGTNRPKCNIDSPPPPCAACMRQWTGSTLVEVIACRLFGTKLLHGPRLTYCWLETNLSEIRIEKQNVLLMTMHKII